MLGLAACGGPSAPPESRQLSTTSDAGLRHDSTCAVDADCPAGMLCEGCADGFKTCVPGCRDSSQCGPFQLCFTNVQCLTCPCPSGWCELDPCHDFDGDGYVTVKDIECPGKRPGDCDDTRDWVNPGATERCANGVDDDCDGRADSNDAACRQTCDAGERRCSTSADCGPNSACEAGCCTACERPKPPPCAANECLLPGGLEPTGCEAPLVCASCRSCPLDSIPVCGVNFSTYDNRCLAQQARVAVLHDGACLPREGHACQHDIDCGAGTLFCRDMGTGVKRCSRVGTCTVDEDCGRVSVVVPCGDGGLATLVCGEHRCTARCE
jgi:hypothetical protein